MESILTIRAGARARERIRTQGFDAADVEIVPGAAGGPKALGIAGLDRVVFGEWLPSAPRVRHLIGASIGAWRFAAACCADPVRKLDEFAEAYAQQRYPPRPSKRMVSESARTTLKELFAGSEERILAHEHHRLHILVVRGRWPLTRDSAWHTPFGFGMAAMANALGRRHLARFIERTVFHDARDHPVFFVANAHAPFDAFRTHAIKLDRGNLSEALLATASIPLVLEGVANVPSAPPGIYWDGGIIDYHLHLPYHHARGLVFYPHFTDTIIPGWLDKALPWRRAHGQWLENVVLVSPSREYLAKLPYGKLPSRQDFKAFQGRDDARVAYWKKAIAESERLAGAFMEFVRRPDPAKVLPL